LKIAPALENIVSGCHAKTHPNTNAALGLEVTQKAEVQFNRDLLQNALAWMATHPRYFALLTARRFVRFWFPYLGGFRYEIPTGALTVLSVFGLAGMYREIRIAALLFASTLFVYPLIHYLVQFEARYRYPIFWATLIPAAYALTKMIHWTRKEAAVEENPAGVENELMRV
jgi:hypothetical protein